MHKTAFFLYYILLINLKNLNHKTERMLLQYYITNIILQDYYINCILFEIHFNK